MFVLKSTQASQTILLPPPLLTLLLLPLLLLLLFFSPYIILQNTHNPRSIHSLYAERSGLRPARLAQHSPHLRLQTERNNQLLCRLPWMLDSSPLCPLGRQA